MVKKCAGAYLGAWMSLALLQTAYDLYEFHLKTHRKWPRNGFDVIHIGSMSLLKSVEDCYVWPRLLYYSIVGKPI